MKATIEGSELVIRLPIVKQPSKSGKNIIVASSHGNQATAATVDGKPVIIGVNAYTSR